MKKWILNEYNAEKTAALSEKTGLPLLVSAIAYSRGLDINGETEIASPFDIADMQRAANFISEAIEQGEKITVYGDYDCDGITATTILYTYLLSSGANVDYYIPTRLGDGYGLNNDAIKLLHNNGTQLIITVDNGISAVDEIDYANSLGLKVIVTDHHEPGEKLPNAAAVVDPKRKDDKSKSDILCGAGVAFKLIAAMENGDYTTAIEYFSDLLAIGTIADLVPLTGENRAFVQHGLQMLQFSENVGITSLIKAAGLKSNKITATQVAFTIAPRINAAGRMGNPNKAIELLLCEDSDKAAALAAEINQMNVQRQSCEGGIVKEIKQMLLEPSLRHNRALVLFKEDWNSGVIGIVAAKAAQKYGKPTFLICEREGIYTGSARTVGEFNVFEALNACSHCLINYGGHKAAGGFSLEKDKLDEFKAALEKHIEENYPTTPRNCLRLEKKLEEADLTIESAKALSLLEPFGQSNPSPIFLLENAVIVKIVPTVNGKHQRIFLKLGNSVYTAFYFNMTAQKMPFKVNMAVDVAVSIEANEYNGKLSVTLIVEDMRPHGFEQAKFFAAEECFEKLVRGEKIPLPQLERALPTREDAVLVYKQLKALGGCFGSEDFYLRNSSINFCKLSVVLTALEQLNLLADEDGYIKINKDKEKVELWSAPILRRAAELNKSEE